MCSCHLLYVAREKKRKKIEKKKNRSEPHSLPPPKNVQGVQLTYEMGCLIKKNSLQLGYIL